MLLQLTLFPYHIHQKRAARSDSNNKHPIQTERTNKRKTGLNVSSIYWQLWLNSMLLCGARDDHQLILIKLTQCKFFHHMIQSQNSLLSTCACVYRLSYFLLYFALLSRDFYQCVSAAAMYQEQKSTSTAFHSLICIPSGDSTFASFDFFVSHFGFVSCFLSCSTVIVITIIIQYRAHALSVLLHMKTSRLRQEKWTKATKKKTHEISTNTLNISRTVNPWLCTEVLRNCSVEIHQIQRKRQRNTKHTKCFFSLYYCYYLTLNVKVEFGNNI